ncbi:hypothetical protein DFH09DRAFT_1279016 [Mycena vulgaris]|nr:hypothetical protein DFH09DRAFT_1279016 [Mycena vulgaris]
MAGPAAIQVIMSLRGLGHLFSTLWDIQSTFQIGPLSSFEARQLYGLALSVPISRVTAACPHALAYGQPPRVCDAWPAERAARGRGCANARGWADHVHGQSLSDPHNAAEPHAEPTRIREDTYKGIEGGRTRGPLAFNLVLFSPVCIGRSCQQTVCRKDEKDRVDALRVALRALRKRGADRARARRRRRGRRGRRARQGEMVVVVVVREKEVKRDSGSRRRIIGIRHDTRRMNSCSYRQ